MLTERVEIEPGQIWRHKRVNHQYEVIDVESRMQFATNDVARCFESTIFVAYRKQGTERPIFFRPRHEFLDGRFERVEQPSPISQTVTSSHLSYAERHFLRRLRLRHQEESNVKNHTGVIVVLENLGLALRDPVTGQVRATSLGLAIDLPREPGAY